MALRLRRCKKRISSAQRERISRAERNEVKTKRHPHTKSKFMPYAVYILKCSDETYYTGLTKDLDGRVREHEIGAHSDSYTYSRRPVKLVWSEVTESYREAFEWEHRIKGWSRAKKEALIRGDIIPEPPETSNCHHWKVLIVATQPVHVHGTTRPLAHEHGHAESSGGLAVP